MPERAALEQNIVLLPWYAFLRNLVFWQATWFLYFQSELSAAEAILLYAVYDISTTALEVPSGYMSDRLGRRITLILSAFAGLGATVLLALAAGGFWVFVVAQILLGAHAAFVSGTDSAMLFESLDEDSRDQLIERHEVRVWRFTFAGLAVSAVTGGALALIAPELPFAASAVAFVILVVLSFRLVEPQHRGETSGLLDWSAVRACFAQPVLQWLFALGVLMYGFSHIPFVFGQPFILEALGHVGLDGEAPLISGVVSTVMMVVSVTTSLFAPQIKSHLGLGGLLLLAFGLQVSLTAVLGWTNAPWAIALLFLRMVPDALSRPFIIARVQPLLDDASRATFLSLKSFLGRIWFALSLAVVAQFAPDLGALGYAQIQPILWAYACLGVALWLCLASFARTLTMDVQVKPGQASR